MAISDKLLYLNGTKQAIKDELNRFGAELTENDTFRSYSNVLNDIYDKLPKVSGNGTDFSLENAQNGKLDSFGMDGNTEQTTYSGKNLCSNAKLQSAANIRFYIDKKIEKTLTISFTTNESLNTNSLYLSATDTLATTITASANTKATATFTLSDEQYNAIQGATNPYFLLFKSGANFTIPTDAQIENGSNATDYEPYVGGTPSPNPDYPQEVKVVENEQIINVHGKNLISKQITSTTKNGVTITNNGNGTYTLNGKATGNVSFDIYASDLNLPTGEYVLSGCPSGGSASTYKIAWNVGEVTNNDFGNGSSYNGSANNRSVWITIYNNYQCNNLIFKPMIEKGSTATEYEPYQSQDYEIDLLDYELCKIGDYQDVIFKNNQLSSYYDSTLDEDSWYIKKNIGKVVLDGTQSIDRITTGTSDYYRFNIDIGGNIITTDDVTEKAQIYSDKLTGVSRENTYARVQGIAPTTSSYSYKTFDLYIEAISQMTIEEVNIWLSNNPVTVYYVLSTPTYEKITNETLISQLESIETFTGLNNFSVSNENNVLPTLYVSRLKELSELS